MKSFNSFCTNNVFFLNFSFVLRFTRKCSLNYLTKTQRLLHSQTKSFHTIRPKTQKNFFFPCLFVFNENVSGVFGSFCSFRIAVFKTFIRLINHCVTLFSFSQNWFDPVHNGSFVSVLFFSFCWTKTIFLFKLFDGSLRIFWDFWNSSINENCQRSDKNFYSFWLKISSVIAILCTEMFFYFSQKMQFFLFSRKMQFFPIFQQKCNFFGKITKSMKIPFHFEYEDNLLVRNQRKCIYPVIHFQNPVVVLFQMYKSQNAKIFLSYFNCTLIIHSQTNSQKSSSEIKY